MPLAHLVSSRRLTRQGQHDAAITEAEQAILSDPNEPLAHEAIGSALVYAGNPSDAVGHLRQAMRLDPGFADDYLFLLGLAQLGTEQYAAAAETLTKAAQSHPDDDRSLMVLAAAYGHLGKIDAAKLAIEKANRIRSDQKKNLPKSGVQIGIDVLLIGPYTLQDVDFWPFREKTDRERLREGLRLAGVPEAGKGEQVSPLEVPGATTVDPAAAKRLFDDGVTFVDVRTPTLWANGHIPGAVFLDLKTMLTEASLAEVVGKDQEVVFYCMGPRCLVSSRACAKAVAWGYQKVYYLRQGYPGWKAAGFLVVIP
ncbi:MAG: tetratricopeptide repeat protein [Proteobacteria bacterium]|nr:tetratricopeptide repeat protein [Pseudomonadota bacterium]